MKIEPVVLHLMEVNVFGRYLSLVRIRMYKCKLKLYLCNSCYVIVICVKQDLIIHGFNTILLAIVCVDLIRFYLFTLT